MSDTFGEIITCKNSKFNVECIVVSPAVFSLSNSAVSDYRHVFYEQNRACILMNQNVINDVTMNSPILITSRNINIIRSYE